MSVDWEKRMVEIAQRVYQVEKAYYDAVIAMNQAKAKFQLRESEVIASGEINLKNEHTRNADVCLNSQEEKKAVLLAEAKVDTLKADLHYWQNIFQATCISAKLYTSGKEI